GSWPTDRGFDRFFGTLSGGGGFWKKNIRGVFLDTDPIELADDFYYTHAITDHAVRFIKEHDSKKPLFLYLAHYAPHRPLEAPKERIDAVRARYENGSEVIRKARFQKQVELGILPKGSVYPQRAHQTGEKPTPAWDELTAKQQKAWVEEMATYAAMVEIMDDGIGEVMATMKEKGLHDNTVYIFLSDNGATMEGGMISQIAAEVSNVPYRGYKKSNYLGGIASPLVVALPEPSEVGEIASQPVHITDLVPTCLELAGVEYPSSFREQEVSPPTGSSLLPVIEGGILPARDFFFEHASFSSIISGDWKLVRGDKGKPWELYHLADDPFEQVELSNKHADIAKRLKQSWHEWAEANHVLPINHTSWNQRIDHFTKKNPDQDGVD
ncbi:MAG: sulfatase-like hydrolase/transferase, partial [Verrucomicrobiota bacterium]